MIPATITMKQAMARYKCDRKPIIKAVNAGSIQSWKPGKQILLDEKQSDEWFLSQTYGGSRLAGTGNEAKRPGRPRKYQRRQ